MEMDSTMKHLDIGENCYAHLMGSTIYLYIDNEFKEMFHIDDIEENEDPIPLIQREMELAARDSMCECCFSF